MGRLVDFFLSNRWLVLMLVGVMVLGGIISMMRLPLEAYPDLTNVQVVVTVQAPGMSPVEVEQLVTFPLESTMLGLPSLQIVRSTSKLELSMVTVIFDDSMDLYRARQIVSERMNEARAQLPPGLEPQMGPMATAFGEVYQYTVQSPSMSLMDIKSLHDWQIRYDLASISGVSEINSWGGYIKQYTAEVDPAKLRQYNLTLHDVVTAVENNNANFGGSYIQHAGSEYTVRGIGRAENLADLGALVVSVSNGTPILLRDVANLKLDHLLRHGAVLHDGAGETMSGMVIILKGQNGQSIIEQVKKKIGSMKLPNGAKIIPFYDQSDVINATVHTVKKNLIEAAILVLVILLIFLGDWRAALIVACTIPLSLLFAFIGMDVFGISINLMSLGAIDFGTIVDGSVVMVENCMHRMERAGGDESGEAGAPGRPPLLDLVRSAAHEVARPITFGVLIIISVYLPVLTLQSLEGRMFRPMAVTVVSALVGSLLLALFAVPAVCSVALRGHKPKRNSESSHTERGSGRADWFSRLRDHYSRSLRKSEAHRKFVLLGALVLIVIALGSLKFIGTEFMPTLDEGSLVITTKRLPGISLDQSIAISRQVEHIIKSFPEVSTVVTKLGRPDLATEAMGVYESDSYVNFWPKKQWKCCKTKQQLSGKLQKALDAIPGVTYEFTQPMEMRIAETITGVRGDAALKIFGPDLDTLEKLGRRALAIISAVPGASEPQMERISGEPQLEIRINRAAAARYGLSVADIQEVIQTLIGSRQISEMIEGEQRYPIAVRLPAAMRNNLDAIRGLTLKSPAGEIVRLDQVTDITTVLGPVLINRENAHRRSVVMTDVAGRDLGGFVKEAQQRIAQQLQLPQGYSLQWGGQYENEQRAQKRLALVLPLSLLIIASLLYATFKNLRQMFLILSIVPLALVGGIAALWIRGIDLNLSASIGFIALFGVAVLNGVVMVSHINNLREQWRPAERRRAPGRRRPPAPRAHHRHRRQPRLHPHGCCYLARRRSAATVGHRRHRRPHHRHPAHALCVAAALSVVQPELALRAHAGRLCGPARAAGPAGAGTRRGRALMQTAPPLCTASPPHVLWASPASRVLLSAMRPCRKRTPRRQSCRLSPCKPRPLPSGSACSAA